MNEIVQVFVTFFLAFIMLFNFLECVKAKEISESINQLVKTEESIMENDRKYPRPSSVHFSVRTQEKLGEMIDETGKSRGALIAEAVDLLYENMKTGKVVE